MAYVAPGNGLKFWKVVRTAKTCTSPAWAQTLAVMGWTWEFKNSNAASIFVSKMLCCASMTLPIVKVPAIRAPVSRPRISVTLSCRLNNTSELFSAVLTSMKQSYVPDRKINVRIHPTANASYRKMTSGVCDKSITYRHLLMVRT